LLFDFFFEIPASAAAHEVRQLDYLYTPFAHSSIMPDLRRKSRV
jgi:hypothetical protein